MDKTNNPVQRFIQNTLDEDLLRASILIVDDMALMRKMIFMTLAKAGYTKILEAEDGDDALEMIRAKLPDIVILDLNMPRLSGYDVCRALRQDPKTRDLPVLVQSASETPEERVQVFEVGATDFVSKPINQAELLARVGMHLQNRFLIKDLMAYRSRVAAELEMAREIQASLLPDSKSLKAITVSTGVAINATYQSSSELGGDIWGAWALGKGSFGIHIMDVTGHGVASALSTIRIHSATRRFKNKQADPEMFIRDLNEELSENFPTGQFATMFYAVYNCETRLLRYCGAGSPPPLLIAGNEVIEIDSSGLPLGISKNAVYGVNQIEIPEGARLILYSDVIIEARNHQNEMIGVEGLKQQLTDFVKKDVPSLHDALLSSFWSVFEDGCLPDDLTLVEINFDQPKE